VEEMMFNNAMLSAMILVVFLVFGVHVGASQNSVGINLAQIAERDVQPTILASISQEPTDEYLLSATPITQARMHLIWADPYA
jgi:hypothetical protein